MADEHAKVREPTGDEVFPRDETRARIYDVARRMMKAAERGEILELEVSWSLKRGGLIAMLGSDPGKHLRNIGEMVTNLLEEIGVIADESDEELVEDAEVPRGKPS